MSQRPPNIVLVVLDDLGIGQLAPYAKHLGLEALDPSLVRYALSHEHPYHPGKALDAARMAMPFINKLAEESVVFHQAYAASNLCAPSRQAILTGSNPTRWGAYRNIDINICGLPQGASLVSDLQAAGYRTGLVGKWHVGSRDHALRDEVLAKGEGEDAVEATGYWGSVRDADHPDQHGFDYAFFYNRWECDFYDSQLLWENRHFTGQQKEYNTDLFTDKALAFIPCSVGQRALLP